MTQNPEQSVSGEQTRVPVSQLSYIITQMEDLINMATECEKREPKPDASFAQAFQRLQELQNQVKAFHDASLDVAKELGLTEKDLQITEEKLEKLSPEERRVMARLDELLKKCEAEREKMYIAIRNSDKSTSKEAKDVLSGKETSKSRRKGKFKYMGGDSGWIHS